MKISYCVTCKGRGFQLKSTLPINLADNPSQDTEFSIVDYNSPDNFVAWVLEKYQSELASGKIRLFRVEEDQVGHFFHHARAKNLAASASTGSVIVNLDADNLTHVGFDDWLRSKFLEGFSMAVPRIGGGVHGRVCLSRRWFWRLRGYDEDFGNYGQQDNELHERASRFGVSAVIIPECFLECLTNDGDKSLYHEVNKSVSDVDHELRYLEKVGRDQLVANIGRKWGNATAVNMFSNERVELNADTYG